MAGAAFNITVTPPAAVSPGTSTTLSVGSLDALDSQGHRAALKSDMEGQASIGGVAYTKAPDYAGGVLEWKGVFSGSQESTKVKKNGVGVTVDDTPSGSVIWDVFTPAISPTLGPDSTTQYPGLWSLTTAGQDKVTTVE